MAEQPTLVALERVGNAPADIVLPDGFDLDVRCINVTFNGGAASGTFIPCCSIFAQSGQLIGRFFPNQPMAVGDSGEVTYAPFLNEESAPLNPQSLVGARVENHAGQNVPNTTNTDRVFDTVIFDTAGMVNLGADNRVINITQAGFYLCIAATNYVANAVGRRICSMWANGFVSAGTGSLIGNFSLPAVTDAGGRTVSPTAAIWQFNSGDFMSGATFQASGGGLVDGGAGGIGNSFMSCVRIGV